jgi:predicted nucleic acid-binding Zn finger protein
MVCLQFLHLLVLGTEVAIGKESRKFIFNGIEKEYLLEYGFRSRFCSCKSLER